MLTQHDPHTPSKPQRILVRPHAASAEIVATVPSLLKGSIRNRVLLYLALNHRQINSIRSIAEGIHTTHGRVSQALVELVSEGSVRSKRSNLSQTTFDLD